ncbi:MAG: extracellular solute-binding protein [Acetatifactor sp.]|nr:extracellular solute-binding protein [Acetatifactor sp.]
MKMWKRVLGFVLAATLLAGLCACNKNPQDNAPNNQGGKKNNANAALAKEHVYRLQEFELGGISEKDDDAYIRFISEHDGRIYAMMQIYNYRNNSDNRQYKLISTNMEGADLKTYDMQISMEDEQQETAPDGDESGAADTLVNPDSENEGYVYESTSVSDFALSGGRIYGRKNYYFEDYRDPDNYVYENKTYICCWDMEGKMLWESPLDYLSDENSWHYIQAFVAQEDGTAILLIGGDDYGKITVDAEGKASELQPCKGLDKFFENSNSAVALPDGKLLLTYYGEDWKDMYAATYDFDTDIMSESVQLPSSLIYNGMGNLSVDEKGDMIFSNNQGVFKYHIGDAEAVQVMSYVNSDLYLNSLDAILPIDDEHFVGFYSEYDEQTYNSTIRGGVFTKVAPEDIPDKAVMVLGGNYIPSDLRKRVVEYNKSSNTHRIVLKDYSQYSTYDDYMAAYTQMNSDIISGNMPDILIVDSYNMSLDNYISKGLLADIGALIEKDEELSKTEFMENVFEACSVDGKLYEIIPSFYVQTYIGKTSLVGDRTSWTMEEARQLLSTMPEETALFGDMMRGEFFDRVMYMCGNDFIDVATGKCSFDSAEFISLMEFAKTLPEERPEDYYEGDWYTAYQSQYRENRTLLASCYISDLQNMVYTINGSFGEDVSFVGFPNASGQGSRITTNNSYALAAGSASLDEAWKFMRYYLTDEYQSELNWQLPVNKKYFDEQALKATKKPSYEDGEGKQVEYDYTWWINDEEMILDPLTMEQLDAIKAHIASVTKRTYYNEYVLNIITEEMDAFYKGQKSAADVASIIQSRAKIYVNENR